MRGGKRPGAGRPPGSKDKKPRQSASLAELAREYTEVALARLVKIATSSESEAAGVSAANALLDRGYGKPPQLSTGDATQLKRALEMTDDELASIAAGGGEGTAQAPGDSPQLH